MGTNFYAHLDACPHCGKGEKVHIGKRSGGWQFHFHGTDTIRSWKDWQAKLLEPTTLIVDEEGIGWSPEGFIAMVEGWKDGKNHFDYCDAKPEYPSYLATLWKDEEGWSFSGGEFS